MTSIEKAKLSLEGLSLGDAFGELFFSYSPHTSTFTELPKGDWKWTDDTHMALSIVKILKTHNCINQDALAQAFVQRYREDPWRGYSRSTAALLQKISEPAVWREISPTVFGTGSYGNGAAMRATPIGGFFADNPARAAKEAQLSAVVTHTHPEGQAGAIAIAVAAAIAANSPDLKGQSFLHAVLEHVPDSETRQKTELALGIPANQIFDAILKLGTGNEFSAQDTVPFCLWSAAYHLDSFEEAMWWTVKGMGDCDTTCAIVGGIVALASKNLPSEWLRRREPLPEI